MEKFFLKRRTVSVENWQIGLLLIIAVLTLIGFGAMVEWAGRKNDSAPGIAKLSMRIARLPITTRHTVKYILTNQKPTLALEQRFDGEEGFARFEGSSDSSLLLARYDGSANRGVVEVLDLESGAILHRYAPDIHELNLRSNLKKGIGVIPREVNPKNYMMHHPYLEESGSLVFHGMYSPLAKIDVCSNIVWTIDGFFHHSIERDADGNYWTAVAFAPPETPYVPKNGIDDSITQISPDGEILFSKSLSKILIENGLEDIIYRSSTPGDPLHLNDIQYVLTDGPYWHRGDLFLSLRNSSTIMLYRPSTNEVLWWRQGPWMLQHDVDIISEHEIAVFNNNIAKTDGGRVRVLGVNDTIIYDFSSEEYRSPFSEAYEVNDIRTLSEGRSEILSDGEIFVEEQNYGRLLKMNTSGDVTWQYVNRADDGRNYFVSWVRYVDNAQVQHVAEIAASECDPSAASTRG